MTNRYHIETWVGTGIHLPLTVDGTFSRHWPSGDSRRGRPLNTFPA